MAVRVRLTRVGSKKNPIWRVVVADQRSPRDGRFIETIGHYNPQTQPSTIVIDHERLQHWVDRGAQPTATVRKLMRAKPDGSNAPEAPESPAVPEVTLPDVSAETEPEAAETPPGPPEPEAPPPPPDDAGGEEQPE